MFITYQQTSEQSYLLNYGEDINIITNKKVLSHFRYLIKNKFEYIFNVVPSFNKLLIVFDTNFKEDVEISPPFVFSEEQKPNETEILPDSENTGKIKSKKINASPNP